MNERVTRNAQCIVVIGAHWPRVAEVLIGSAVCKEKCLYDKYSGGRGCSRFVSSRCFLIFRYPNTETNTMNTTQPRQLPMIRPNLRVRIELLK